VCNGLKTEKRKNIEKQEKEIKNEERETIKNIEKQENKIEKDKRKTIKNIGKDKMNVHTRIYFVQCNVPANHKPGKNVPLSMGWPMLKFDLMVRNKAKKLKQKPMLSK
jgi:hypothetical protein